MLTFLKFEGINYTKPGRKDQVYNRKSWEDIHMYKPKHLFWTWREVLAILNQELCNENSFKSRSEETLKFPSLYGFIEENKEVYCHGRNCRSHAIVKDMNSELVCEGSEMNFKLLLTSELC